MEKNRIIWLIGILMVTLSLIFFVYLYKENYIFFQKNFYFIIIPMFIGLALIMYGLFTDKQVILSYTTNEDERTRHLKYKSRSYTLSVTIVFIAFLGIIHYRIIHLELKVIWWFVLIQIVITFYIFKIFFNKKEKSVKIPKISDETERI